MTMAHLGLHFRPTSILTLCILLISLTSTAEGKYSYERSLNVLLKALRNVERESKSQAARAVVARSNDEDAARWPLTMPHLRIAAFNVQMFGQNKITDEFVKSSLVKIFQRYDLVVLQEIRDKEETATPQLVDAITKDSGEKWEMVVSERLGRTSSKEQYAFIFRASQVEVLQTYQYKDTLDVFERPPFGALFKATGTEIGKFAMMAIHTSPGEAEKEIDALVDVYDDMVVEINTKNIIIAGDFNADCTYVTGTEWKSIRLFNDPRFKWFIDSDADTTVSDTVCAYDRFVIRRGDLEYAIVQDSVGIFKFDEAMQLTQEQAKEISDHYPIELKIMGKIFSETKKLQTSMSFTVTANLAIKDPVKLFQTLKLTSSSGGFIPAQSTDTIGNHLITAADDNVRNVLNNLGSFSAVNGDILSDAVLGGVEAYMDKYIWNKAPSIVGLENLASRSTFGIIVVFDVTKGKVHATVTRRVV